MKKLIMSIFLIFLLAISILFISGCGKTTEQIVGNDRDEHGCIGSAGYSWCEAKQKCLRTWEESCKKIKTGNAIGKVGINIEEMPILQENLSINKTEKEQVVEIVKEKVMGLDIYKDNNGRNLKIVKMIPMRCINCYSLNLQFDKDGSSDLKAERVDVTMTIKEFKIDAMDITIGATTLFTSEECLQENGRILNTNKENGCSDHEKNMGEVYGLTSLGICCMKIDVQN